MNLRRICRDLLVSTGALAPIWFIGFMLLVSFAKLYHPSDSDHLERELSAVSVGVVSGLRIEWNDGENSQRVDVPPIGEHGFEESVSVTREECRIEVGATVIDWETIYASSGPIPGCEVGSTSD